MTIQRGVFPRAAVLLLGLLVWAGAPPSVWADDPDETTAPGTVPDSSASGETISESGDSALIPIPIIFYSPETKFAAGASVLYLFGGNKPGTQGRPSSLSVVALYTQKKQVIAGGAGNLFLSDGRTEITGAMFFKDFPTQFYGVGNETPESAREKYTPREFDLVLRATRRVRGPLRVGAGLRATHLRVRETDEGRLLESSPVPGVDGGWVAGLGLTIGADTRDAIFSARGGYFADIGTDLYDAVFGSDYAFTRHHADLRVYLPVFSSHVFATRIYGVSCLGETPFQLMPQLGGGELLRGYYEGRFRERNLLALQVEYRFPVYQRFGLAVFGSAGQVAHSAPEFRADGFHFGGGLGARFLLSRESGFSLRTDWGFGKEDDGLYFSFGEAF